MLQDYPGIKTVKGNKIDLIRVLLTIGIVFLHATMTDLNYSTPEFKWVIKSVINVTMVCLPMFFAFSGYLFFRNVTDDPQSSWFWSKLRKRFSSLFIPFIIANCVAFMAYFTTLKVFPSMISGFLGNDWKDPGFVLWKGPINLSLWFIRELIKLTILTPIIFIVIKHLKWWSVLFLGVMWKLGICPEPLFWYSSGVCLSIWKIAPIEKWLYSRSHIPVSSRAWTFFIYLYHYLLIIGIKKSLVLWIEPRNTFSQVSVYLASAIGTLAILTAVYALMRRIIPRITSVIVGGK